MRALLLLAAALLAFALVTCVTGRDPPEPTALVEVAGGPFLFGSEQACFGIGKTVVDCSNPTGMPKVYPTLLIEIEPFAIEEHEVTNEQYDFCVQMGACPEPAATNVSDVPDYFFNPVYRRAPVVNVTLKDADAYCRFLGRRLPTEAEWERAAAGPFTTEADKHKYPFADGLKDLSHCQAGALDIKIGACQSASTPADVGTSKDDFVYEGGKTIWDLGGNVAELVQGYYADNITCAGGLPDGCRDCFLCKKTGCDSVCEKECKEHCYTEDACPCVTGKLLDGTAIECYKQCAGDPKAIGYFIPVCIEYPAGKQDASVLYRQNGTNVLARGGAFSDKAEDSCRASTTDRNAPTRRGASSSWSFYNIGFRCAADPTCVDGKDNNNDGLTDAADPLCRDGKPGGE
jgi:formylglycine-generating enzyme required for sulfatase activity